MAITLAFFLENIFTMKNIVHKVKCQHISTVTSFFLNPSHDSRYQPNYSQSMSLL